MNIVVTGFEPFGGAAENASWQAVQRLTGVERVLLPVSFARAAEAVRRIVALGPDAVILTGEAAGRNAVSVERVAVNLMDARIPDNDGAQPVDLPVRPGGPAAWLATLPTRAMMEAMVAAGVPAALSYTAGTYVCNCAFYALMDAIARSGRPIPGGFIHVPAAGMPPETAARGLRIAVDQVATALGAERIDDGRENG